MHHHGDMRIRFRRRENQVAKKDLTGIAACSTRGLQNHRAVGLVSRFHDGLHLLKVVHVESRNAIAVFSGMVEQKPKRNERHRKSPR